jgi:hypothetical protein
MSYRAYVMDALNMIHARCEVRILEHLTAIMESAESTSVFCRGAAIRGVVFKSSSKCFADRDKSVSH